MSQWSYNSGARVFTFTTPNGILTSPSDQRSTACVYSPCVYTISQRTNTFLNFTVQKFDIYYGDAEFGCKEYLEFRDGSTETSPLVGKFCGTNIPGSIQTTQNKVWIGCGQKLKFNSLMMRQVKIYFIRWFTFRFHSDSHFFNAKGFQIMYNTQSCGDSTNDVCNTGMKNNNFKILRDTDM